MRGGIVASEGAGLGFAVRRFRSLIAERGQAGRGAGWRRERAGPWSWGKGKQRLRLVVVERGNTAEGCERRPGCATGEWRKRKADGRGPLVSRPGGR
jgi:hypothetical protein